AIVLAAATVCYSARICGASAGTAPAGTPSAGTPSAGTPSAGTPSARSTPGLWDRDALSGNWGGLRDTLVSRGVTLGLQEQSEVWDNLSGGLNRGAVYDGLTTASMKLDL